MPRLRQVSRAEAEAPIVTVMYDYLFEGRDPVAEPGTATGTPGDWWTVFALVPDVLEHAVQGFGLYQSPKQTARPRLRELAQARAGWAAGSQFVFSQHCKSLRALEVDELTIASDSTLERRPDASTRASVSCWPTRTAWSSTAAGCPTASSTALRQQLADEEILELTYIAALYLQHAVMSRALRTEFDDRPEPMVEVMAEGGGASGDVGLGIALPPS